MLKNAIDWGSKPIEANVWRDKPTAMTGTSPGAIGTAVGQQHLRQVMGMLGASVLGGEAYLPFSRDLFDAEIARASAGRTGFGIADAVERQFARFVPKAD